MKRIILVIVCGFIMIAAQHLTATAQTTGFNYQGSLNSGGSPANGNFDFEFALFDALTSGAQVGSTVTVLNVTVANGTFSTTLDFGAVFGGTARFLEVRVRTAGGSGYTALAPRQQILSVPYAVRAVTAGDTTSLGGVAANQYLTTTTANATFVQNSTTAQTGNFNINGTGTANIFSASQFNIGANRVLKTGSFNVFVGVGAGTNTTADGGNTFVGGPSGTSNTTGTLNSFFGSGSGESNVTGSGNSYFGYRAGQQNSGSGNTFIGGSAGNSLLSSTNATLIGSSSSTVFSATNATAIGAQAFAGQSNTLVLGSVSGVNGATTGVNVGIGLTSPTFKLQVFDSGNTGLRVQTNGSGGTVASFGGLGAFQIDATGTTGGRLTILENGNFGIGTFSPTQKFHVVGNGLFTGSLTINGGLNYLESVGNANFFMRGAGAANGINFGVVGNSGSNSTLYIAQYDGVTYQDRLIVDNTGVVNTPLKLVTGSSGTITDSTVKLEVRGFTYTGLDAGGTTAVCRSPAGTLSFCSSSIRYKRNIENYTPGIDLIRRLRPVSFNWLVNNEADFGLVAEEVAATAPLLVTRNEKGEVEGVKYDRVGVVLVNAVNEQQLEIEAQRKRITELEESLRRQQAEFAALKALVCAGNAKAAICKQP